MKKFFVGLVVLALSVVGLLGGEQKFSSLPIGANLDGYISSIRISIGTSSKVKYSELPSGSSLLPDSAGLVTVGGTVVGEKYSYIRNRDGALEEFAIRKLREAIGLIPDWIETGMIVGNEAERISFAMGPPPIPKAERGTAMYGWGIDAITDGIGGLLPSYNGESKPATIAVAYPPDELVPFYLTLRNGKWEVPEEVFGKVKFSFGVTVGFYIPTANDIEVNFYNGTRVSRFSTREQVSDADNPCELPALTAAARSGWAIGLPSVLLKPNGTDWWSRAEITLYEGSAQVTFVQHNPPSSEDGTAIRWSTPPPSFFAPPSPPAPITLQKTGNGQLELTLTGEGVLEESKDMVEWGIPYSLTVLSDNPPRRFRVQQDGTKKFYRLRQTGVAALKR